MNNLDIIKKSAKMGYSALLEGKFFKNLKVVAFTSRGFIIDNGEICDNNQAKGFKITGYTHVGNLFGEPKIKEGQKFRVKETGEIWDLVDEKIDEILLKHNNGSCYYHYKSELEPYFE